MALCINPEMDPGKRDSIEQCSCDRKVESKYIMRVCHMHTCKQIMCTRLALHTTAPTSGTAVEPILNTPILWCALNTHWSTLTYDTQSRYIGIRKQTQLKENVTMMLYKNAPSGTCSMVSGVLNSSEITSVNGLTYRFFASPHQAAASNNTYTGTLNYASCMPKTPHNLVVVNA